MSTVKEQIEQNMRAMGMSETEAKTFSQIETVVGEPITESASSGNHTTTRQVTEVEEARRNRLRAHPAYKEAGGPRVGVSEAVSYGAKSVYANQASKHQANADKLKAGDEKDAHLAAAKACSDAADAIGDADKKSALACATGE
jgi:hypothetical protein